MLKNRLLIEWSAISLLASFVVALAVFSGVTRPLDNLLFDAAATQRAPPASDKILIVEIDNLSHQTVGKWPWPRDVHARMVESLGNAQAASVAYDVLFVEPGTPVDDAALAKAIAENGRVALPVLYNVPGANGAPFDIFYPIPELKAAAKSVGTVNLLFDSDGLVRRAQLRTRADGAPLNHLMEQIYRASVGKPSPILNRLAQKGSARGLASGDADGSVLIPYLPSGSFRHIGFSNVLRGEVPDAFFRDKIVLVGSTADGSGDRYSVPALVGSTMSGVEIQANLLNGMLSDQFVVPAGRWVSLLANIIPAWLLMFCFLRWRPTTNLLASLGFIAAVITASTLGIVFAGYWIAPAPALLGLLLVYPLWGWRRLEALSSFVFKQTRELQSEAGLHARTGAAQDLGGLDSVAEEALQLRSVIGELRGVQRFMSDVVSGFPDAICVVDAAGTITMANPAAHAALGPDLIGVPHAERLEQISSGTAIASDELRLADGRTFLIRRVSLTSGGDESAGSIIRFADISRLRDAEQEREEMLAFLSHDMRAPQAAIIALLEGKGARPKSDAVWTRVAENARKTMKLAEDFVHSARASAADLTMTEVDVAAAMTEAVDVVWPQAKGKSIEIIREGLDAELYIRGDYGALVRALTNLIDNAVKYAPPDTKIFCRVAVADPGHVECGIQDQGPGLPSERQADPFARFGARGDHGISGSGLGLAYVKKVVTLHQGQINWRSKAGEGTCFTLRLAAIDGTVPLVRG